MTIEGIKKALHEIAQDKLDDASIEYMSNMVMEEDKMSEEIAVELIGPFLVDGGVTDDDGVLDICRKFVEKINITTPKVVPTAEKADRLDTPILLGDVIQEMTDGYNDPYLGIKDSVSSVNTNSSMSIGESMKLHKSQQRERDKQLKAMREWERSKRPLPQPKRYHGDAQVAKVTDIIVDSFCISVGGRNLLTDAPLKLCIGRKYGLAGRNGIGKSTFLSALALHDILGVSPDITIGCVEQEITWLDITALESVLAVDEERCTLLEEEKVLEAKKDQNAQVGRRIAWVYERLETIDAMSAPPQAAAILSGLGFTETMQHTAVKRLSGGWRMRVSLARALFANPDILLLDEPTNHLDLKAVAWLSEHLQNWDKTIIVVSHAREFLNEVCTDMMHFADQTLTYYKGNYDAFEETRAEKIKNHQKQYESQLAKKKHTQQFIDKFRYNAKRASLVQSRIKALNKLPLLEAIQEDASLGFSFFAPEELPTPILELKDVSYTYEPLNNFNGIFDDQNKWILRSVDLNVSFDSRLAICGVNGSGKSTLLQVLIGAYEASWGYVNRHNKLRIGYFSQHHVDTLDLTMNAVQELQKRNPNDNLSIETARTYLGRFGISGLLSLEPLYILSGGQKSRVAIALMAYSKPHILVLDEPTNHLDLDAVQCLIAALNSFEGGVVLVSHDAHLLTCVVDEVWHVDPEEHTCKLYKDDFETYKKELLKNNKPK